jgi:hypothetical protein
MNIADDKTLHLVRILSYSHLARKRNNRLAVEIRTFNRYLRSAAAPNEHQGNIL